MRITARLAISALMFEPSVLGVFGERPCSVALLASVALFDDVMILYEIPVYKLGRVLKNM
jgi:hypothetical protein